MEVANGVCSMVNRAYIYSKIVEDDDNEILERHDFDGHLHARHITISQKHITSSNGVCSLKRGFVYFLYCSTVINTALICTMSSKVRVDSEVRARHAYL